MDEKCRTEFFGLGPNRMEFRIGKALAGDRTADRRALETAFFDRSFELLNREVGILQRQRTKGRKAIGMLAT